MQPIIVVNNPRTLPISIPGIQVIPAKAYLIDSDIEYPRDTMIFNLCRSYRYQSIGYYVSLLAAARGHRPLPSVSAIQDMKSMTMVRYASDDLEELIQTSLHRLQSKEFTLSIYFGRNMARAYDRLARELFNLFRAPMLRAHFHRDEEKWSLVKIGPIGANEITMEHWPFVVETATDYFSRPRYAPRKKTAPRYDLAILHCPQEANPPSNERALKRFMRAAAAVGMEAELIDKDDYGRLAEFDALFIRETTQVNHHTFRFARRAEAEGLVVIDDPKSILRCCNKVYLAELLARHHIPAPKTVIIHKDNIEEVSAQVGLPCILKQPDSSFSQGVVKADTEEELQREAERLLDGSDLILGQEFIPTAFDWRVGILDRKPLYVCRYYMAPKHWQIQQNQSEDGEIKYGRVEAVPLAEAPKHVVAAALRAANLIGDGLYGVDLKEVRHHPYVIEINDNPSLDCGFEDGILKDDLYRKIMEVFLARIERVKQEGAGR
ncbi:RimK family protein [bacterium]|nr:RimK family protein [bacterium]